MTLREFANVDCFIRDLSSGQEIPWEDYMGRVIEKLGVENIKPYLPFSLSYLKEKLKTDVHLNNTDLRMWNYNSGFAPYIDKRTKVMTYKHINRGVADLFVRNGITCFSVSECVSVLKHTARMLCNGDD